MKNFKKPDPILLLCSLTLIFLGALILSSVSAVYSMEKFGKPNYSFNHQLLYGLLPGLVFGAIAFFIPLERLKKISFWLFVFNLAILGLLLFSKLGLKFIGASRWLNLGLFAFQPSELLKLSLILYLGALLSRPKESSGHVRKTKSSENKFQPLFLFLVIMAIITVLLALQPDIGTLSIAATIGVGMFFLAQTPLWQNIFIWIGGAGTLAILIKMEAYRLSRLFVFLNPNLDPMGQGYQIKQSLIAIGSGGLFGLGLGLSRQKFGFLPQTIGDAIFPVFAEEAGFVISSLLILVFLVFTWQGLRISSKSQNSFSRLVGMGISIWIGGQALINICSMTGILPLTGIPLPFISYGGSHLVSEMIGLGILLNISKQMS